MLPGRSRATCFKKKNLRELNRTARGVISLRLIRFCQVDAQSVVASPGTRRVPGCAGGLLGPPSRERDRYDEPSEALHKEEEEGERSRAFSPAGPLCCRAWRVGNVEYFRAFGGIRHIETRSQDRRSTRQVKVEEQPGHHCGKHSSTSYIRMKIWKSRSSTTPSVFRSAGHLGVIAGSAQSRRL